MSADNEEVGKPHAVIMDPRDNRVTHIVINTGPHFPEPGFGAPDLITVPVDQMVDAQEERVILKCTKRRFAKMPLYVERRYGPPPPPQSERLPQEPERRAHLLWDVGAALVAALAASSGIGIPAET